MSVHYDRIIEQALAALAEGAVVHASEGDELGTVKEVRGESVKIDARMQPDYWLSVMHILVREDGRVETNFSKSELGAYKQGAPSAVAMTQDATPAGDSATHPARPATIATGTTKGAASVPPSAGVIPSGTGVVQVATTETGKPEGGILSGDQIVGPEEQMEQRLRMERELAAQRRDLPHAHADGSPDTSGTIGPPVEREIAQLEATGEPIYDSTSADVSDALKRAATEIHGRHEADTEAHMREPLSDLGGAPRGDLAAKIVTGIGAVLVGLVTLRWLRRR